MGETEEFQKRIGYNFHDEELLLHALTHSSYANEKNMPKFSDNERLEFLGDAVLEVVSSDFLYLNYPKMNEGEMSKLRASLVCEPTLAYCTQEIHLGDYILLGKGEELTGGRLRKSILSDALEAVIGAIYLDGGLEPARKFIMRFILTDIEHKKLFYDTKTALQELVQADHHGTLSYVLVGEEGPDHDKKFTVEARIDGRVLGTGEGRSKKHAEQEAAYQALLKLHTSSEGLDKGMTDVS